MASFLRSKQSGMQKDLSAAIQPQLFEPLEQSRFGVNSQIRFVDILRRDLDSQN